MQAKCIFFLQNIQDFPHKTYRLTVALFNTAYFRHFNIKEITQKIDKKKKLLRREQIKEKRKKSDVYLFLFITDGDLIELNTLQGCPPPCTKGSQSPRHKMNESLKMLKNFFPIFPLDPPFIHRPPLFSSDCFLIFFKSFKLFLHLINFAFFFLCLENFFYVFLFVPRLHSRPR